MLRAGFGFGLGLELVPLLPEPRLFRSPLVREPPWELPPGCGYRVTVKIRAVMRSGYTVMSLGQ